ncbi:MAG: YbhB/YbcL family Raf kinase inhibitor-like protein [Deltaproteobacteria bacterium CG11_big_fil_rev_8_21_14_0_20_47_16]|nr:MAG: YbhB/YbcL family Raf kinase inhibitor-like protein [Deltaproteobacteria bacterium CG11_big_fil_rev_8_21_14_0_20_47_16]
MASNLIVISTAFQNAQVIPEEFAGEGRDVSPPLAWRGAPANTKSFALICNDPDAPNGNWVHWVLFNIPASTGSLVMASKGVGVAGDNSWSVGGYRGPMPPAGSGTHRYFFKVYALDTTLNLPAGATAQQLQQAMQGHVLSEGQLMGKYSR